MLKKRKNMLSKFIGTLSVIFFFSIANLSAMWMRTGKVPVSAELCSVEIEQTPNESNRLIVSYATQFEGGGIYEIAWDGSNWTKSAISLQEWGIPQIALATISTGPKNVYAVSYDKNAYQYEWNGSSWIKSHVGSGYDALQFITAGTGRNDSQVRIYASDYYYMFEYSWSGTTWTRTVLNPDNPNWPADGYLAITLGKARNDGIDRLYGVTQTGKVFEYEWNGSTWGRSILDQSNAQFNAVAIADAKNDGKMRIYVGGKDKVTLRSVLYELSWNGSIWVKESINYDSDNCNNWTAGALHITAGKARDDLQNRLYVSDADGNIYEFSWNGTAWKKVDFYDYYVEGGPANNMHWISIGDGRNDGTARVYGANGDGYIYEYTWTNPMPTAGTSVNGILSKLWDYSFGYSFLSYDELGPSAALGDVDTFSPGLEIVTGSREYYPFAQCSDTPGRWLMFKPDGTVAWWKSTENDEARSSVVLGDILKDGTVKIIGGTTSGNQIQVRDKTGALVWKFTEPESSGFSFFSTPAMDDVVPGGTQEVVAGSEYGYIHLLDGADGHELWNYITAGSIVSSPSIIDLDKDGKPDIIVASENETLYVLTSTGTLKWKYNGSYPIYSSPATADLDGDQILEIAIGIGDKMTVLDGKSGLVKWSYTTGEADIRSSPAIGDLDNDGKLEIVFGSPDTYVYCLSNTGALKWKTKTGGAVYSSPSLAKRSSSQQMDVYVGSDDNFLYLLKGDSGAVLDKFETTYKIAANPVVADIDGDGKLEIVVQDRFAEKYLTYKGDKLWVIRDLASNVDPYSKEWPMFRANARHTGVHYSSQQDTVYIDTIPPAIQCLNSDMTVEATSPSGTVLTFSSPTISDDFDPCPKLTCNYASSSTFPVGVTTVTFTAIDASGNSNQCSFWVKVQDTAPPISKIINPSNNSIVSAVLTISGTTYDGVSEIQKVEITIFDVTSSKYWNGLAWEDSLVWNTAVGTTDWTYNCPSLSPGHSYTVQSKAMDSSNNLESTPQLVSFQIIEVTPVFDSTESFIIVTIAGNGTASYSGNGGPATLATLFNPTGIDVDSNGNVYISEHGNHTVRKINSTGTITTVAGSGIGGFFGDGGLATSARLNRALDVAVDQAGNIYIADHDNDRIRKVNTSGVITTVAGTGVAGFSGDGGPATSAQIYHPTGIDVDNAGNLYIADFDNHRIRKVNSAGTITTVAGSGCVGPSCSGFSGDGGPAISAVLNLPADVTVDGSGNLYISDFHNHRIRKVSSTGTITTVAGNGAAGYSVDNVPATSASLFVPIGVAVTTSGVLYISDNGNHRIRKVSTSGIITTIAGTGTAGFAGDGGPATSANLNFPRTIALDSSGSLYVTEGDNNRVRKIFKPIPAIIPVVPSTFQLTCFCSNMTVEATSLSGAVVTFSSPTVSDNFDPNPVFTCNHPSGSMFPLGITTVTFTATDTLGNSSQCSFLVKVQDTIPPTIQCSTNTTLTVEANSSCGATVIFTTPTVIDTVDPNPSVTCTHVSGSTFPIGITTITFTSTDVSGNSSQCSFLVKVQDTTCNSMEPSIITTVAGNGTIGFSGDGGPATLASFNGPAGVTVDNSGNIYIADTYNYRIRKITHGGVISTLAGNGTEGFSGDGGPAILASISTPFGIATDSIGNVFFTDTSNHRIRKVNKSGVITTVAGNGTIGFSGDGGPATLASLNGPAGVTVDNSGNIYIADTYNYRVRKVDPSGIITTVAGNGISSFSGDGGPDTLASINAYGVYVDGSGNILIATGGGTNIGKNRIRKVDPSGIITTVAGNGTIGFSGDGGPATLASLNGPAGVIADSLGNIFIVDDDNHRVRKVNPLGIITTVVGNGTHGFSGDCGTATSARLAYPRGIAMDSSGNIYIADFDNNRVRKVSKLATEITAVCPKPVGDLAAVPLANRRIALSWSFSSSSGVASYKVYMGSTSINYINPAVTLSPQTNSWTAENLISGVTYKFVVRTLHNSGCEEQNTNVVSAKAFDMPFTCPKPVGDLAAVPLANRRIALSWSLSSSSGVASYKIYMGTSSLNYAQPVITLSAQTNSWTAENLTSGVTYKFAIRTLHSSGCEEENVNSVSATAFDTPPCLSASIKSPHNGRKVSGERLTIVAETPCDNSDAIKSVRFEYRPLSAQEDPWQLIPAANENHPNPDSSFPYFIHWNVSDLPSREYQIRAVAVDKNNLTEPSTSFITIIVDHSDPDSTERTREDDKQEKIERVENHKDNSVIISNAGLAVPAQIQIPAGALSQQETKVNVRLNLEIAQKFDKELKPARTRMEITLENGQHALQNEATLTLPYPDENKDGIVDGTDIEESNLSVYYFNPSKEKWEKLSGSNVDKSQKTVTAKTDHFSLFGLFAEGKPSSADSYFQPAFIDPAFRLREIYAFPNPAKNGKNPIIHIGCGIADSIEMRIYDLSGELVHSASLSGQPGILENQYAYEYLWDVSGAASGIYVAVISASKEGEGSFKEKIRMAVVK